MALPCEEEWQVFLADLLARINTLFNAAERDYNIARTYEAELAGPTLTTLRYLENCLGFCETIHGMISAADSVHWRHLEKKYIIREFQELSRENSKLQKKAAALYVKMWRQVNRAEDAILERFYWR